MTTPSRLDVRTLQGAVPLSDWGVIRARGADAATFLHNQLTQDIEHLDGRHARLAGYCSAKGRLLASFVVWKGADDDWLLACSADVLPAALKRLSMFVLRAKCKLSDASAEVALWGLAGAAAMNAIGASVPLSAWQRTDVAGAALIRLPDAADNVARCLWAGSADGATAPAAALPVMSLDDWCWLEVTSGVVRIVAATVEQFVPQMVNLELVGGVDFQKGCYPGQEVVARSQYRGTLKRRAQVFELDAPAQAGQEVFHSADPDQPAGQVANAASIGAAHCALVEVKLAALAQGSLHLGSVDGPLLHRADLPYALQLDGE